jgi:transposase
MKAYSLDLRERVVAALDTKEQTQAQVAQTFGVSLSFVKKLVRQRLRHGHIAPLGHAGGKPPKLDENAHQLLRARVAQHPDVTLAELQAHLQAEKALEVSVSTVTRALQTLELRRKKNADRQ